MPISSWPRFRIFTVLIIIFSLFESAPDSEATFADFYRIAGLRGVYLASQLKPGVTEKDIRYRDGNPQHICPFRIAKVYCPDSYLKT